MFAEKSIFGNTLCTVDSKRRIVLPTFTFVENGEQLVLLDGKEIVMIISKLQMDLLIDYLVEMRSKSQIIEEQEKYDNLLVLLYESVIKITNVDKQRRILLGEDFNDVNYVRVVGAKEYAYIKKEKLLNKMYPIKWTLKKRETYFIGFYYVLEYNIRKW